MTCSRFLIRHAPRLNLPGLRLRLRPERQLRVSEQETHFGSLVFPGVFFPPKALTVLRAITGLQTRFAGIGLTEQRSRTLEEERYGT